MTRTRLEEQVLHALVDFTRETALNLPPAYFELHVHPEDYHQHLRTTENLFTHHELVAGVSLVIDHKVSQAHPELVCTWRRTL